MFKMMIDERDPDRRTEVYERLMHALHEGHSSLEVRLGDGLKVNGKVVEVRTPGDLAKALDDKYEKNKMSLSARREEIFTALEAINSQNFDTPGAFWAARFGDPDLLTESKSIAIQKFRNFILDDNRKFTDVDYHNFHAADYLLAKTCTDPTTSVMVRDAMNEKAAVMLSNEIGYEEENGVSINEQVKRDAERFVRIMRYDDKNRLKILNRYATGFRKGVSNYAEKVLQKVHELSIAIDAIDTMDGMQNAVEMGVYKNAVGSFLLSMGKDASCPHPALDSRNAGPDGTVVMNPCVACDYATGRPFVGFAQFVFQRQIAMDPMCRQGNSGAVYFIAKNSVPAESVINPSLAVKVPVLRRHLNEQRKNIFAADAKEYVHEDAVMEKDKGHKTVYVDSTIRKFKGVTGVLPADFAFSSHIDNVIPINKDTSGNLLFSKDVTKYFASYFAAARTGVPFKTDKATQEKVAAYMLNGDVMKQLMQKDSLAHDVIGRAYSMSTVMIDMESDRYSIRSQMKQKNKVHSSAMEM